CQLSTVNCQLSTVNCQLSTVNCQLSTVNCQLPTISDFAVGILREFGAKLVLDSTGLYP
ncbi:MAG: hypothetical protein JGK08_10295, partial [Microcoleus sp. PH2017_04_SCI_O_A]|nr:hypothetical protein [Microcoleus sp. PH2017_04_SCI_O_A]